VTYDFYHPEGQVDITYPVPDEGSIDLTKLPTRVARSKETDAVIVVRLHDMGREEASASS
jgi:hypothetical protein